MVQPIANALEEHFADIAARHDARSFTTRISSERSSVLIDFNCFLVYNLVFVLVKLI